MRQKRDYNAEYRRRMARGSKLGLSRSQARGHARSGETPIRPTAIKSDQRLEEALRTYRQTGNQATAAKSVGISPERLRRFLRENVKVERRGRSLSITDDRRRRMTVITEGATQDLILAGFEQASLNGKHLNAVRQYLGSNDIELLLPFDGLAVIDAKGKAHPLETNPNALHRINPNADPVLDSIGHFLLGLADMLRIIVERLYAFGRSLIERADQRLEGEAA